MTYEQAIQKAEETSKLNNGRPFKVVPVTYMNNESGFDVTPDDAPKGKKPQDARG